MRLPPPGPTTRHVEGLKLKNQLPGSLGSWVFRSIKNHCQCYFIFGLREKRAELSFKCIEKNKKNKNLIFLTRKSYWGCECFEERKIAHNYVLELVSMPFKEEEHITHQLSASYGTDGHKGHRHYFLPPLTQSHWHRWVLSANYVLAAEPGLGPERNSIHCPTGWKYSLSRDSVCPILIFRCVQDWIWKHLHNEMLGPGESLEDILCPGAQRLRDPHSPSWLRSKGPYHGNQSRANAQTLLQRRPCKFASKSHWTEFENTCYLPRKAVRGKAWSRMQLVWAWITWWRGITNSMVSDRCLQTPGMIVSGKESRKIGQSCFLAAASSS